MFEKAPKGPKTLNPGKSCADCVHHVCSSECMQKPHKVCKGYCTQTKYATRCSKSGKMCKEFKQVDWRKIACQKFIKVL